MTTVFLLVRFSIVFRETFIKFVYFFSQYSDSSSWYHSCALGCRGFAFVLHFLEAGTQLFGAVVAQTLLGCTQTPSNCPATRFPAKFTHRRSLRSWNAEQTTRRDRIFRPRRRISRPVLRERAVRRC